MTMQITGKAMMLDEIINYVQSLQRQVEVSVIELLSESLVKSQDFFGNNWTCVSMFALDFSVPFNEALSYQSWAEPWSRSARCKIAICKVQLGAKNVLRFTVPIAHIDWPFINACHCRSFAHKMLMRHFRDTVHKLAACILTCSGHLNKVSRIHNHTEWSQIHQMFMWQDRFSSYFSYLHFHRFVLDAPEQQQQVSKCLATTNGN